MDPLDELLTQLEGVEEEELKPVEQVSGSLKSSKKGNLLSFPIQQGLFFCSSFRGHFLRKMWARRE